MEDQCKYPRNSVLSPTVRSLSFIGPTAVTSGYGPVRLAFTSLLRVLRNSSLFIAIGWLFGYCFTLGNLFSSLPPSQQSIPSFNAASMAWWYGVFSACMVIIISAKLHREQFVANPASQVNVESPTIPVARKLKMTHCIRKLIRPASPFLLFGAIGAIGSDFGIHSLMPDSWRPAKPFLYIAAFWGFFSMVILDVYARRIFQTETIRGLIACSTKTKTSYRPREIRKLRRHTQFWIPSYRRFLYVYRQNLPVMIFTMISIVYVHVVSRFINSAGQWGLFALSSASIALKLMLQELAKHMMTVIRRPVSRRVMVALVSTPTILVDTQVRILLLRQTNLNVSVAGTVFIAFFEIAVRATKSTLVQRQTREPMRSKTSRRRSSAVYSRPDLTQIKPMQIVPVFTNGRNEIAAQSRLTSTGETPAQFKARRDAMERRHKIRVLHVGEIYADMYAEYIAIGCSFVMLFFFRNHPQYEFCRLLSNTSGQSCTAANTEDTFRDQELVNLGYLQMGLEVVVDFLACTLEATRGVDFKSFDQNDPFLIFFLGMLTFSNIGISAGLYMH